MMSERATAIRRGRERRSARSVPCRKALCSEARAIHSFTVPGSNTDSES